MGALVPADREIHFGRFRLHPVQGLSRGSREIHVTPKALALLRALAARAGEVVTKEELFQQVWPRAVVTEASLATCIQELRTVLQDDARHPVTSKPCIAEAIASSVARSSTRRSLTRPPCLQRRS